MVPEPMSQAQFWSILDSTVSAVGAPDVQIELLKTKLSELKPDDLIAYEVALDAQLKRAYTWDFVAVADILNDGVTDDGFLYFRLWLISMGRKVFEKALLDPDSLADAPITAAPGGYYEFEDLLYPAKEVWSEVHQNPNELPFYAGMDDFSMPSGTELVNDNDVAQRFPKLWKRFRD